MIKKILHLANKLDTVLTAVFPKTPVSDKDIAHDNEVTNFDARVKRKSKNGFFKETFRNDKRKELEAYVTASTQAEQNEILKTMKDSM